METPDWAARRGAAARSGRPAVRRPAAGPRRPLARHAARGRLLRASAWCSSPTCWARAPTTAPCTSTCSAGSRWRASRRTSAFQLDQLSMTFVLLITGVGTLIHIYSIGYMEHDERRRRFFGYLNLFLAAMLLLVLADNYLLLYVGWEGVGLASYLLIGFWQHKPSAATAAKKAFLVNRVGDMGLSIAIMLMFTTFGTFAFGAGARRRRGATPSEGKLTGIGLMLLLAACGKSAQVPLQSWLGDAMEGPTPVSALIHAATMVTAGVYLITRSGAIFNARAGRPAGGHRRRRGHAALRCDRRLREGRHQEGAGRLDDVADRLHDPGRRARPDRLRLRDHAPGDARLLQGRALPRRRFGHARHERRGRHAQVRRPAEVHAGHLRHLRARLPRDHRLPRPVRLLLQGQDHRGGLRQGRHRGLDPRRRAPCWARPSPRTT